MLQIDRLTVAYGDRPALRELTLDARAGEVLCVLGPSGCGKSTLLRAIAGLEPARSGTVSLGGRPLTGLRPDQRQVSMMFQDHALFPHRDVHDNVAFGLRMRGASTPDIEARVTETLDLLDLAGFGPRPVTELSGGERQRVALARAIAPRPQLLMLDEPLGSLDRALQTRLLAELPHVFAALATTVIYVTHDQHEAMVLADRVAVMRDGRIEQVGAPDEVWRRPRNAFVAEFLGLGPVFDLTVTDGIAMTPWGAQPLPGRPDGDHQGVLVGAALRLAADTPALSEELAVPATVVGRRFAGDHYRLLVQPETGPELAVGLWRDTPPDLGEQVTVLLDPAGVHVFEQQRATPPT